MKITNYVMSYVHNIPVICGLLTLSWRCHRANRIKVRVNICVMDAMDAAYSWLMKKTALNICKYPWRTNYHHCFACCWWLSLQAMDPWSSPAIADWWGFPVDWWGFPHELMARVPWLPRYCHASRETLLPGAVLTWSSGAAHGVFYMFSMFHNLCRGQCEVPILATLLSFPLSHLRFS